MNDHAYQTVNTNQLVVTRANSLVYATYEMTLQEKRLLLLLFSMIRQEHTKFHIYCIPVRQIGEFLGIDPKKAYKVVEETCHKLMSRVLHVQSASGDWDKLHWVSIARYRSKNSPDNRSGEAELQLKAHDELHPLLLELKKQFASVPLEHVAHLSSYHSIRLFEILFHKSHRLEKPNVRMDLDQLKKILGVEGKYPNFADFKRRVLEPAKKNLEKKTPIKFTYLTVKEGRKVTALDFVVTKNLPKESDQIQLPLDMPRTLRYLQLDAPETEAPPQHEELIEELMTMGYMANGLELIQKVGEQEVRDVLELAREQEKLGKASGNEIKNMGGLIGYLIQTEAWKPVAAQRKAKEEKQKKADETRKQTARSKKVAQLVESINETYSKACLDYKQEQWKQLDDWQQEQIKQEIKQNGDSFTLEFLDKHGWDEEVMSFIVEREAAMKRLGIPFKLPEHLNSKENYINSQAQYQNNEPEVIQEVIATLRKQ